MKTLNLFVPEDAPGYEDVLNYIEMAEPDDYRWDENHVCCDKRLASGYWVSLEWWDQRRMKKAQKKAAPASATLELADIQLSAEALALIQKEDQ